MGGAVSPAGSASSPFSPWFLPRHRRRHERQEVSDLCVLSRCFPWPLSAPPTSSCSRSHLTGDSQTPTPRAGHGSPKRTDALFPGRAVRAPQRAKASPCLSPRILDQPCCWRGGFHPSQNEAVCSSCVPLACYTQISFWNEGRLFLRLRIAQHQPPRGACCGL